MKTILMFIFAIFCSMLSSGQEKLLDFKGSIVYFEGRSPGAENLRMIDSVAEIMKHRKSTFHVAYISRCAQPGKTAYNDDFNLLVTREIYRRMLYKGVNAGQIALSDKPRMSSKRSPYNFIVFEYKNPKSN